MMTRKEAKKQFKAFRKMAHYRFDHMGTGQKYAGLAMAGVLLGLASWIGRSMMTGDCATKPEADKMASAT